MQRLTLAEEEEGSAEHQGDKPLSGRVDDTGQEKSAEGKL